jgi:FMN phosphatase YigB (HAD superfamily)
LTDIFDNIWSTDDFGTGKNDPEIYRMAAQRIGTSVEEITFLDDNVNADRAAKLSGVKVIGVYDDSTKSDESQMRMIADGYIHNFIELEEMVKKDYKY